jgi:hypothetical protein
MIAPTYCLSLNWGELVDLGLTLEARVAALQLKIEAARLTPSGRMTSRTERQIEQRDRLESILDAVHDAQRQHQAHVRRKLRAERVLA